MDGICRKLKNLVYRKVKSAKISKVSLVFSDVFKGRDGCIGSNFANNTKEIAEYTYKTIKGISSLYMSKEKVIKKPKGFKLALKIPEMLTIQKVECCFKKERKIYFKFYYLALSEPYHANFYQTN